MRRQQQQPQQQQNMQKYQQSKIPTILKREGGPPPKTEKSTALEPNTPGKPVANNKNNKLSTDEELLSQVNQVGKVNRNIMNAPCTEEKKNNKKEFKFGTSGKYDPKCATGIPWILSKKTTQVKPFHFASEELAMLRAAKAKRKLDFEPRI